jgi:hypothetical protein
MCNTHLKVKILKLVIVFNTSTQIATVYNGAAVPPVKLNAPDDGQIG